MQQSFVLFVHSVRSYRVVHAMGRSHNALAKDTGGHIKYVLQTVLSILIIVLPHNFLYKPISNLILQTT